MGKNKDKTVIGITGKPIPKPRTPTQQHKLEQKRRKPEHLGPNVGGYSYRNDVNPYFNPRSIREEILVNYLLDEGFASDEKSAHAITIVMSEEWKQSIVEEQLIKIEVTPKEGKPYLRFATLEKIKQLQSNPNIQVRRPKLKYV